MNSEETDCTRTSESSTTLSRTVRTQPENSCSQNLGRRNFLRSVGGVVVAGLIAGCTNDSNGSNGNTETNNSSGSSSVEEWLADTGNYDSVEDMTGKNAVTVEVGAEGNSGANAFAPAAIKVSPGTTVTWKWVDGYHNVVDKNGQFSSGEPEQGATFDYTFETTGTALYYCEPHRSMDMKGAVIVEKGDDSERSENTTGTGTENA